jgi:hypothetical protein
MIELAALAGNQIRGRRLFFERAREQALDIDLITGLDLVCWLAKRVAMPNAAGNEWQSEDREQAFKVDPPILGYDTIVLTEHTLDRMSERQLTLEDVKRTLREPDEPVPSGRPDRIRLRRNKTARVAIDVVFEEHPACLLVVSVIKVERRLVRRRPR